MHLTFREIGRQFRKGDLSPFMITVLSSFIAYCTFPALHPVYANGIDPPLSWLFNYLIQGKLLMGKDIIFPHGPLAFIMYPLPVGINLKVAIVLYFLLRAGFAYSLLRSRCARGLLPIIAMILTATILLSFLDILLVMTGLVLMGYVNYLLVRNRNWLAVPAIITVAAVYVKAFVGIVCIIITIGFILILLYETLFQKRSARRLLFILVFPVLLVATWFLLYGTFSGFFRYLYGMVQLAGDNSAAVAYYPDNNWWLLGLAGFSLVCLIIVHFRQHLLLKYIILAGPALFAVWKYGMAREDYLHAGMFFSFIVLVLGISLFLVKRRHLLTTAFVSIVIVALFLNLRNSLYYEPMPCSFPGFGNLNSILFKYGYIADTCNQASEKQTGRNRLEPAIRELVGKATCDVYPWDYSYIPVNDLNWKPRPVLQSYACYTPWLDGENAVHFASEKAPEFLLWELRKITHDVYNGSLESIDGRYILNDQPETMLSLFQQYRFVARQQGRFPVLVLQKREEPLGLKRTILKSDAFEWNTWYPVPETGDGVIRLNAAIHRNFSGGLKSFFYKDEACYIYYLLDTDEIRSYRIVPRNAAQGIWVNPLILNADDSRSEPRVRKIMLRSSDRRFMKDVIPVTWERISFEPSGKEGLNDASDGVPEAFFGKTSAGPEKYEWIATNDLESSCPGWSENPLPETGSAFSGTTSCRVKGGSFSCSCEMSLDSLLSRSNDTAWQIRTDAWVNTSTKPDANFVISIELKNQPVLWKAVKVSDFVIEKDQWNCVFNFLELSRKSINPGGYRLKVYAWNLGRTDFLIDDMRVMILPK